MAKAGGAIPGARFAKLKQTDGRLASAKSKTGNPACSQAMSSWVRSRHGGPPASSEVFKVLAMCRSQARQNKGAAAKQAAGKLAEGRGTWQRSERAAALVAQRAASRASPTPAGPSLREQADAHRAAKGTPKERAARISGRLDARLPGSKGLSGRRPKDTQGARVVASGRGEEVFTNRPGTQTSYAGPTGEGSTKSPAVAARWKNAVKLRARADKAAAAAATPAPGSRLAAAREALKAEVSPAVRGKVLAALHKLDADARHGAAVPSKSLRAELAGVLPRKPEFDRALRKLAREGHLTLHRTDRARAHGSTEADRRGLVRDGRENFYIGASLTDKGRAALGPFAGARGDRARRAAEGVDVRDAQGFATGEKRPLAEAVAARKAERAARLAGKAAKPAPAPERAGRPGSIVLRHKAINADELKRLSERPTTIDGEDFAQRRSLRGQSSFLGRVSTVDSGAKAPDRGSGVRANLARRIREARAKSADPRSVTPQFGRERINAREFANAAAFDRKARAAEAKKQDAREAAGPAPPRAKQGGLFGPPPQRERPDARAVPVREAQSLADQLWARGQKHKAAGRDDDAKSDFGRHDEIMSRLRQAADKRGAAAGPPAVRAAAAPPTPPRPSLRAQADAHRRAKGNREQRVGGKASRYFKKQQARTYRARAKGDAAAEAKAGARAAALKGRILAIQADRAARYPTDAYAAKLAREGPTGTKDRPYEAKFTTSDDAPAERLKAIASERADARSKPAEAPPKAAGPGGLNAAQRAEWRGLIEASRLRRGERRQRKADRIRGQRAELTEGRNAGVRDLPTDQIHFDPERFQYKLGAGKNGSVGSLAGVKKWDPELGGVVQVWKDPADGKTYVVNGHNRLDLAKRLNAGKITARHITAGSAEEAKAKGAITNIAEGRGTAIDAAKFFSAEKISRADLEARGIPMREKVASDGLAMAALRPQDLKRVIDGDLPQERAVIVGGAGLDHSQQKAVFSLADKRRGEINNKVLRELVAEVKQSSSSRKGGGGLFGDDPEAESNALHRAALKAHIKGRLGSEKRVFGTVAKGKNAKALARANNVIDSEESGRVSRDAAENLATFDALAGRKSKVSELVAEGERRLAAGEKSKEVYDNIYARLRAAVREDTR